MRFLRRRTLLTALCAVTVCGALVPGTAASAARDGWRPLAPAAAPDTNPLKGFIPYAGSYTTFPYAMEWFYLPLDAVVAGPDRYDWRALESQFDAIAARGHQAAFRFYLDYPGKPSGVPRYLLDGGLATHAYPDYGNNGVSVSPDYDNPTLDTALDRFIAALGARYDGDPRIGFLQLGLLGFWGEWHTYPYDGATLPENWFASEAEQVRILHDYDAAFDKTELQARPEIQGCIFDAPPDCPVIEGGADNDYPGGVAATHASWLLNQYAFDPGYTGANRTRALAGSTSLGYTLRVTDVEAPAVALGRSLRVGVRIQNLGVAPFSYNWPLRVAAVDSRGRVAKAWTTPWQLTTVEPGSPRQLTATLTTAGLRPGTYTLILQAVNPLPRGVALRFANAGQDTTLPGWLTLGRTLLV